VEQDTEVQVRTKNLEATRLKLTIDKDQEFASLSQTREIETLRAEQTAQIATQQAERNREAESAKIEAERQVSQKRIEAEREIRAAEIDKNLAIQSREIELERQTEVKRAEQRKQVEMARQDMQIAIANKSREQSEADAAANQARAEAVKAEEAVNTAREVAVAERDKEIQLIEAAKDAEQNAIALLLQQLPAILEQAVRPMEKIDSIRIFQANGLPGTTGSGSDGGAGQQATFPEQVMNSALQYQIAKPIVDAVMKDAGLSNDGITGMANVLSGMLGKADNAPVDAQS